MTTESADYCMLVNEWAWSRSRVCLLGLEVDLRRFSFGVRAWTDMVVMYRLKLVSSEGLKGYCALQVGCQQLQD